MLKLVHVTQATPTYGPGRVRPLISVPNLKRIALFVHVINGSQKIEIGSRDHGHTHLRGYFMVHEGSFKLLRGTPN